MRSGSGKAGNDGLFLAGLRRRERRVASAGLDSGKTERHPLSQETIAIIFAGATLTAFLAALAAIVITLSSDMRAEARADRAENQAVREAIRAENQAERAAWQAESQRIRDEDRADREAWQAEMRALREDAGADREAVSRLSGIVEQMRTAGR